MLNYYKIQYIDLCAYVSVERIMCYMHTVLTIDQINNHREIVNVQITTFVNGF